MSFKCTLGCVKCKTGPIFQDRDIKKDTIGVTTLWKIRTTSIVEKFKKKLLICKHSLEPGKKVRFSHFCHSYCRTIEPNQMTSWINLREAFNLQHKNGHNDLHTWLFESSNINQLDSYIFISVGVSKLSIFHSAFSIIKSINDTC